MCSCLWTSIFCVMGAKRPMLAAPKAIQRSICSRNMITFFKLSTLTALLLSVATTAVQAGVIFDRGSTWKYFIGTTTAPSTPAWRTTNFNDSAWQGPAPAPIGYGEPDIITALPASGTPPTYTTVYFRKTFVIPNPADVSQIDLFIRIDDGYLAWINGTEIGRFNV